jgi:hypothetical protein
VFQPGEYFNITFSLPVSNPVALTANSSWSDYRHDYLLQEITHLKNRFGL